MADEKKLDAEGNEIIEVVDDKKPITIKIEVPKVEPNKSYTAEEAQKFIDDAIKAGQNIAKGQLYPEITKLKAKVETLDSNIQGKVDPAELEKLSAEKEVTVKKLTALEDAYIASKQQLDGLETQLRTEKLESYKQKKIASSDGKIIPELVVGNSTEEIDTSIEKAKVKYAEIQNELRQKYNLPTEVDVKKKENEQEEKIVINRLGTKADLGKWELQRKDLLKEVYGKYGVNV